MSAQSIHPESRLPRGDVRTDTDVADRDDDRGDARSGNYRIHMNRVGRRGDADADPNRPHRSILAAIAVYTTAALLTLTAYGLVRWAGEILLVLFMGLLFGVFLHGLTRKADDYLPKGRKTALFAVVAALALTAGLIGFFCYARVQDQIAAFTERFDQGLNAVQERMRDSPLYETQLTETSEKPKDDDAGQILGGLYQRWMGEAGSASNLTRLFESSASLVVGILSSTLALITSGFLIGFVGLFLAAHPDRYRDGAVSLCKPSYRGRAREIVSRCVDDLWNFLLGRGLSMIITGVGATAVLWICGVPLAVTIGVLTALLTFIPNIGAIVAWGLAAVVAMPEGGSTVLAVTAGYVLLQIVESYVITPLVQKKQVDLSPAVTLAAQAIFSVLFGVVGALAATPLVVVIKRVVKMAYVEDRLETN